MFALSAILFAPRICLSRPPRKNPVNPEILSEKVADPQIKSPPRGIPIKAGLLNDIYLTKAPEPVKIRKSFLLSPVKH